MITIGIDPGLATCGVVAVNERGRILALAFVGTSPIEGALQVEAMDLRVLQMRRALVDFIEPYLGARQPGRIIKEARSTGKLFSARSKMGAAAVSAMIAGIAAQYDVPIRNVFPQVWERSIDPTLDPKVAIDYETNIRPRLAAHVVHCAKQDLLDAIKREHREHVLDAAGIAVYGALNWAGIPALGETKVAKRKPKKRKRKAVANAAK